MTVRIFTVINYGFTVSKSDFGWCLVEVLHLEC